MNSELQNIIKFHIPRWSELPNIDLYIDQVICYLDDCLLNYVSKEKEEHILTKTMINNYVKHSVIMPAVNKKYNKEHIAKLFIICILKQIYSISDITNLFSLITRDMSVEDAYNSFCDELEKAIFSIFNSKEKIPFDESFSMIKNIVVSFVYKLYVDKIYLKKF